MNFSLFSLYGEVFLCFGILGYFFWVFYLKVEKATTGPTTPLIYNPITSFGQIALLGTVFLLLLSPLDYVSLSNTYFSNDAVAFLKVMVLLLGIVFLEVYKEAAAKERLQMFEFQGLVLITFFAVIGLLGSQDLLLFYILLEIQSLSTYILVGYRRHNMLAVEGSLKYFVLGALASGFFLLGLALLYGATGTTNLVEIGALLWDIENLGVVAVAAIFIIAAVFFKLAAAPFHNWAPDVYEAAEVSVTMLLATVTKLPFILILVKFLLYSNIFSSGSLSSLLFAFSGLISLIVGVLGALYQVRIKRFVAYSGIANVGYVLLALGSSSANAYTFSIVYISLYVLGMVNLFLGLSILRTQKGELIETLSELSGLSRSNPILGWLLALTLFSLVGIPPLLGFFAKYVIIESLVDSQVFLALAVAFFSVISALYYIRLVKIMFFEKGRRLELQESSVGVLALFSFFSVMNLCAIAVLDLIYFSSNLL